MRKPKTRSAPVCVFCGRSEGAQFVMFAPRFPPFGTACADCEETIPKHITSPAQWTPEAQAAAAADNTIANARAEQFKTDLDTLLAGIHKKAEEQFAHNEKSNLPEGRIEPGESVPMALMQGIAGGWNGLNHFDCQRAIECAHTVLEDANCHTEAARLAA